MYGKRAEFFIRPARRIFNSVGKMRLENAVRRIAKQDSAIAMNQPVSTVVFYNNLFAFTTTIFHDVITIFHTGTRVLQSPVSDGHTFYKKTLLWQNVENRRFGQKPELWTQRILTNNTYLL